MTGKTTCIIVDDEPLARELMETHIAQVESLHNVASCTNAMKAFDVLNKQKVDLMFLDIQMPLMTGLEFLRGLKNPPKVIITTAFRNYALEGFELDVVDYLLKPITFERFFHSIEKFNDRRRHVPPPESGAPKADFIFLKSNKKNFKVYTADILYIESQKDYITVFTSEGKHVTKQSLSEIEALLKDKPFLRIHRSYLINLHKLTAYTANDIEIGKIELPIGSSYHDAVQRMLQDHKSLS